MKIVVIGGSGRIGSKLVQKLSAKGHQVIAASPSTGVNSITGEGLAEALANAQVVVDVANSPSFDEQAATTTKNCLGISMLVPHLFFEGRAAPLTPPRAELLPEPA